MKNLYHRRIGPYRCLEKAYRAGKRIQKIKKNYFLYRNMLFSSKRSWQSIPFYTNTELNDSVFIIYLSLFEYRISLYLMNFFYFLRFRILNQFQSFSFGNKISKYKSYEKGFKTYSIFTNSVEKGLIKKINRKLAWIEATLNDSHIWKHYYLFPSFTSEDVKEDNKYSVLGTTKNPGLTTIAYESIGFLPRSITRTFSRFKAELTNQSSSLVLQDFRLAKYQALASLQYIGCLIIIPLAISIFSQKCFSEPWINHWWNSYQSQIFITSFQEEKALEKLREIEELFWLDKIMANPLLFETHSQNLNGEIHQQTIDLVENYNDDSIKTISHLLTDIVYLITLSGLFILGKERLVILNSWAQELFYSLSDTMKAFSILLLTDLCIGFHSPHGWELVISSCFEHFGFVHNKRVISCFVSTFPVILDTVFKYWIFRHLNRISPSIVATYHTMNE